METPVKLIVGNWKMNGLAASLDEAGALRQALEADPVDARVGLCPPATLIAQMAGKLGAGPVELGGQDCHQKDSGAFTGSISAAMLADAGARLVILGHSERREGLGETDADVAAKVEAALRAGLEPIICVGESLDTREAGRAVAFVTEQVRASLPEALRDRRFAVAYEPIWAIGTGLTPTLEQIGEVHGAIRATLAERLGESGRRAPILYGGSMKPDNAAEILAVPDVGGGLVGGASLKADDFIRIIRAA
ncbi:triose-phosphate isomerase [Brevundimonas sp.]|uniref:triose-phosphate isomerase n=1 Tax=Brevundimonas sp. TaxID=1871086 RepID=UPI001DFA0E3F|nr:triose-phosphate isomerase [Brevundimonas sp.]MBL0947739.1 triose-phosphate isomerase [Brevundimonas sp.]